MSKWMAILGVVLGQALGCGWALHAIEPSPAFRVPVQEAKVELRRGEPLVLINGEPTFFAAHLIRNYRIALGQAWSNGVADSVRQFRDHGIHRFEVSVGSGWKGVDEFDPLAPARYGYPIEAAVNTIVAADPDAQIMLRVGIYMETDAWRRQNPDEVEQDQHGRCTATNWYMKTLGCSFGSDSGFAVIERMLGSLVAYVERSSWRGHIVGYNVYLQYEGMPWGSVALGAFTDYSPAMRRAWRVFLKQQYGTDERLRAAWGNPAASLADAGLPLPEEHLGDDERMLFHHPVQGRKARDYYALVDSLVVKRHRQIAQAMKKACNGRRLVGFMGGYSQDAGEPREVSATTGLPRLQLHKQHFGGSGCWGAAFDIPEIDFYFAPLDYLDRGMGGVSLILNMPASQKLHGKACWMEDDSRTHLYTTDIFNPWVKDARASIMIHRRNMALLYTEAGLSDWMEQISNWLLDPVLLKNLGAMNQTLQESLGQPDQADAICVLIDEESQGWMKPTILLDEVLFYHQRNKGLSHCGIPVRYHLLSDLAHDRFPAYKFYILPNAYHWTAEKESWLAKIKRNGNVLLWMYAAGYVGNDELGVAGMERATGFKLACAPVVWEHRISITDFGHPITQSLPADCSFGTSRHYGPIFRVTDVAARELGRSFGNRMNRHVALAIKEVGKGARGSAPGRRGIGDYASIYCEAPDLPSELLREMARYAGCHVYLESNDFLIAGKDIVMIHSAKPGPRTLRLPRPAKVTDVFGQAIVANATNQVEFAMEAGGGTRVFRLEPPEEVLSRTERRWYE